MFEKDPRTFSPEYKKLSPEQQAMVKLEITLSRFFKTLDRSLNRWQRLMIPLVLVLAILGLSGFYLIYHMTQDMDTMSSGMDPEMQTHLEAMSNNMAALSQNISVMTVQITKMVENIENMSKNMDSMDGHMENMDANMSEMSPNMAEMNETMKSINQNMGIMSQDMGSLNHSISRPARFMNNFIPW